MKLKLLLVLMLFGLGGYAQVGVSVADTSLRATVNGQVRTWKNFEYYKTAFGLYYSKTQIDGIFAGNNLQSVLNRGNTAITNISIGDGLNNRGYNLSNGSFFQGNTNQSFLNFGSSVGNNYIDNIAGGYIQRRVGGVTVNQFLSDGRISGANGTSNNDFITFGQLNNSTTAITQNIIRYTPIYSPVSGGTTLTISEFANTVPISIIRGNQEYKVSGSATETTVTVNTANGLVTTYYPFGSGETIYGVYQGVTPGAILTDGFGFSIVQNYLDIITNIHWGGSSEWTFYVFTDFQNMSGKKGAYKYIPGFTITPAQIAINFND